MQGPAYALSPQITIGSNRIAIEQLYNQIALDISTMQLNMPSETMEINPHAVIVRQDQSESNNKSPAEQFAVPEEYYDDWVSVAIRRLTHGKMVWGILGEYGDGLIEQLRNDVLQKKGTALDWVKKFDDSFSEIKQEMSLKNNDQARVQANLSVANAAINFAHGKKQKQKIDLDELLIRMYKNIEVIIPYGIQGEALGEIAGSEYDLLSAFVNIFNNFLAVRTRQFKYNEISLKEIRETIINGKGFLIKKRIENNFAIIEFQDNVDGIPQEYLVPGKYKFNGKQYPKLFDYGFSKREGGTGIGLAETLFVIIINGGDIDIISTPGKGTTFVIKLPLKSSAGVSTPANIAQSAVLKTGAINSPAFDLIHPLLQSI